MERILIVHQNWLGDALFSTPALRALKKKFPNSRISCLVPERCRPALRRNPHADEIIVTNDKIKLYSIFEVIRTVRELRKRRFDAAFFFHRSKSKALLALLAGIPRRIGYAAPFRKSFLTAACPEPREESHRVDFFLRLLEASGIPSDGRQLDFNPDPAATEELTALFKRHSVGSGEGYAVLHAGGNWDLKRWPAGYFAAWAKLFLKEYPYKIILCGTASEKTLTEQILKETASDRVVSFCGETSLDALALLLKNAKMLLTNDSGPMHLAASQGTKISALFGPTSPGLTGPVADNAVVLRKDVGCKIPCYFRSCHYRVCMELLSPEEVFAGTREILR